MRREQSLYNDRRWTEQGPILFEIRRSWDTWRVGVRTLTTTLVVSTRQHWWYVDIRFSKAPRRPDDRTA